MASPRFYYLQENSKSRLDDYEFAARLSYFVWSSMPDAELLEHAADGSLLDPDVPLQRVPTGRESPRSGSEVG